MCFHSNYRPDRLSYDGGMTFLNESSDVTNFICPDVSHGDWIFDGIHVCFASKNYLSVVVIVNIISSNTLSLGRL